MTGRRIAVIGGGISGLTAGYVLSQTDHVTLFEADRRLGGHADTHLVGPVPVDTGFIVYNERTYPLLTRLFTELGVSTRPAEMSMSVRCAGCGLHYAGKRGPAGLAAGLRQGGGRFLRLLADVPRFQRSARQLLAGDTAGDITGDTTGGTKGDTTGGLPHDIAGSAPGELTFGDFLDGGGYSSYFQAHFALPLVAAVWSCPAGTALRYPARYLFAFLANHGMLSVSGSPPWRTVTGGSRCYVERVAQRLACVRLGAPVRAVHRHPDGAEVRDASGQAHQFDAVVIATHPDQALALLAPATRAECEVLGAFRYTPNPALLHTDARLLPDRPAVRASWNYELTHCQADQATGRTDQATGRTDQATGRTDQATGRADQADHGETVRISYHMNRLQGLPAGQDYIMTLNGQAAVDPDRVISRMDYAHPAYTPESVAAQRRLPELTTPVTAFAGAYHGWGFHEDGCRFRRPGGRSARGDLVTGELVSAGTRPVAPGAVLYECRITHTRLAPLRNVFTYRTYQWLVDLDHLPRLGSGPAAAGGLPRPRPPGRSPAGDPREPRPLPRIPRHRPGRRPGDDARPRPRVRLRVQPADRLLVPPGRRHAGLRGGRGSQHLRAAARLPAAPRRPRPGPGPEAVLRLAVLSGRRRLPDVPARARAPRPARTRSEPLTLSVTLTRPDGPSFVATVHGTGRPPRALLGVAVRHPWSTAAVSARIRWQGIRLYMRGLPVVPRPPHQPQEGVQ